MAYDRFMIAPYDIGLKLNQKPWTLPEQAFNSMNNAYVWRGRVRKRVGAHVMNESVNDLEQQYHTRLRTQSTAVLLGTTDGAGALAGVVPGGRYAIGQWFSIGAVTFTVTVAGLNPMVRNPVGGTVHTYNTGTGAYVFTGEAFNTAVYFYPSGPLTTDAGGNASGFFPGVVWEQGQMISVYDPVSLTNISYEVASSVHALLPMTTPTTTFLVGRTNSVGDLAGFAPGGNYVVNNTFTIGTVLFTVVIGAPGPQVMLRVPAGGLTHTFDIATGAFSFSGEAADTEVYYTRIPVNSGQFDATNGAYTITNSSPNSNIYFYPNTPVMGFTTYETGLINDNSTYAFDTQFAYEYVLGAWQRLGLATWTGNETQFFWGTSWRGVFDSTNIMYVTNFNPTDHIRYWDSLIWRNLDPVVATGVVLNTCRILLPFHNYLVALNGIENGVAYVNRAYWSKYQDPLTAVNWNIDIPGNGAWLDAPTKEPIVTATIIKDRLIVYCSNSTWELVYLNNEENPFRWQQINSELGAQSTFSCVNFDRSIIGIGSTGIHSCNGIAVERIDTDIPDEVYNMLDTESGVTRTCGIRDFKNEMIYWAVPRESNVLYDTSEYPNSILAFNYKNNAWAYFDDTITAWGYYRKQDARTWGSVDTVWLAYDSTWEGGDLQNNPKLVMAGNHHGWTFIVDPDYNKNSMSLAINNINTATLTITCPLHNLPNISYIYIDNCNGIAGINGNIYQVSSLSNNTLRINLLPGQVAPTGVHTGNGIMIRVSQINFKTKDFNFYVKQNRNTAIYKVDFLVNSNQTGKIFVSCYPSYSALDIVDEAIANQCILGTSELDLTPYATIPLESFQEQFWHPIYFNAEGEAVQFRIYYNDTQMIDPDMSFAGFQLQAMTIFAMPTSENMR